DEIFIIGGATDDPFETERGDRTGADPGVAIRLRRYRGGRFFRYKRRRLFRFAARFGTVEDTRNRRQRVIGRFAQGQHEQLQKNERGSLEINAIIAQSRLRRNRAGFRRKPAAICPPTACSSLAPRWPKPLSVRSL